MPSNQLIEEIYFASDAKWVKDKEGTYLTTEYEEPLLFSCPPVLGGKITPSPEDLFLAAIATCTLTTVLHICDRLHTSPDELNVKVSGVLRLIGVDYKFQDIKCEINVWGDEFLLERACELAIQYCAIGNAIKPGINYHITLNSDKILNIKKEEQSDYSTDN